MSVKKDGFSNLHIVCFFNIINSCVYMYISVVRLLDFHNRSSKIIVQEVSIDDRL